MNIRRFLISLPKKYLHRKILRPHLVCFATVVFTQKGAGNNLIIPRSDAKYNYCHIVFPCDVTQPFGCCGCSSALGLERVAEKPDCVEFCQP